MSGSEFGSHASLMLLVAEAAWARIKNRKVARSLGKAFITINTASMEIISNHCAVLGFLFCLISPRQLWGYLSRMNCEVPK